ncbi:MAG: CotH kinase family protein [Deltaproteobacteria bacterium]|nr:CotH kinase family protein [Deltaproteobacteria bacterium]
MLLLALACTGQTIITTGGGDSTPAGSGDTGTEEVPGDTDTDTAQPGEATLVYSPDGGGFVNSVEVTLSVEGGSADIEWCAADPDEATCNFMPYTGPFSLDESQIVHARLSTDAEPHARAFVEIDSSLVPWSSNIPVFVFWTETGAPSDTETHVPMGMVVLEPPDGGELGLLDAAVDSGRARMRVRGSSSSGFEKKAYDLELWEAEIDDDRSEALLGLPANGDWALYAPYYFDDALVRNPLAYGISNAIGRYAPRTAFMEMFLAERGRAVSSSDYIGVYVLVEEVERDPDRVDVTELLPEDVAEPEVTGGYIFKIDRTGPGESGFSAGSAGGEFEFQQGFVYVQPDESTIVRAQSNYLKDRIDSAGWALAASDLVDPFSGLPYDEIIDVGSFIDHHIVNIVMKNPDAFRLSGYYFQDREGLVNAGPVWDFDRTAGSADSRSYDPEWWDNQNETGDCTAMFTFGWYEALFEIPEFQDAYWTRFEGLLENELSEDNLVGMIDTLAEDLVEPAARNSARWGSAGFEPSIADLEDWMRQRHRWMLACIQSEPDPRDCRG